MKLFSIIVFSLFFLVKKVDAASCCVANASIPQFMTLASDWQLSTQASYTRIIGDVDTDGKATFRGSKNKEKTIRLSQNIAWARKHWQLLAGYGITNRSFQTTGRTETSNGFSDVSLSITHDFEFPDYQLRFFPFYTHVFPTGKAQGSLTDLGSGRAQDTFGLLSLWFGVHWDAQFTLETHRNGETERLSTHYSESFGGSAGIGAGYVPFKAQWRFGGQVTSRWEGAGRTRNSTGSAYTSRSQVWDTSFTIGRQLGAHHNVALAYADQTLLGPARNTRLGRTGSIIWQMRF